MDEAIDRFVETLDNESERKARNVEKMLSAADVTKVFSQPVTAGGYTVITGAEVAGGGGFGGGMGFGAPRRPKREGDTEALEAGAGSFDRRGAGSGGGGGGGSMGRPVVTIVIGPDGVEVQPVVDVTKVGLAALTAFGTVAALAIKLLGKRL